MVFCFYFIESNIYHALLNFVMAMQCNNLYIQLILNIILADNGKVFTEYLRNT